MSVVQSEPAAHLLRMSRWAWWGCVVGAMLSSAGCAGPASTPDTDASSDPDAGLDAARKSDATADAPRADGAPIDATGVDAASSPDTDVLVGDDTFVGHDAASIPIDAFVGHDAFAGNDAFVGHDACARSCAARTCGPDGCGGTCGSCGSNTTCTGSGQCQCNAGFYPSPAGTFCIPPTGSCAGTGVGASGYCADASSWIWCDPVVGLRRLDCASAGLGRCVTVGPGAGACACAGPTASITTTGQCGTIAGGTLDGIYRCNAAYGVIYSVDCRDANPSGFCATFATSFGSGPSCMCGACNPYDTTRHVCLGSACPGSCSVTSGSPPIHACL